MNYEEKYKEALRIAEEILRARCKEGTHGSFHRKDLEDIFPELKDSEDEKIRKEILEYFQQFENEQLRGVDISDWIFWLEKQGKTFTKKDVDDAYLKGISDAKDELKKQGETMKVKSEIVKDYIGEENVWNNAHDFRPEHMKRCLCYDKYMGGVYCYVYDDISKYWCTQTTEEHDPDGDNHICDYADYRVTVWMSLPRTPFYPKKQDAQKSDKVEPKFHEGDWVVREYEYTKDIITINQVVDVKRIDDECFGYALDDGTYFSGLWENSYHLWTIQDAKDGDVLVGSGRERNVILMFRGIGNAEWDDVIDYHCYYDYHRKEFIVQKDLEYWGNTENNQLKPATKEQRELLFQKMKEAGYEWDSEKKELKIINWSKHIKYEPNSPSIIEEKSVIDEGKAEMDYCFTKMMNGEKINPAWSDVDEADLNNIIWLCNNCIRECEHTWIPSQAIRIKSLIERIKNTVFLQPKQNSNV